MGETNLDCRLEDLERAEQRLIDRHHRSRVVKLSRTVDRAKGRGRISYEVARVRRAAERGRLTSLVQRTESRDFDLRRTRSHPRQLDDLGCTRAQSR